MTVRDNIFEEFIAREFIDEAADPYDLLIYIVQDEGSVWETIDPALDEVAGREVLVVNDGVQYTFEFDGTGESFEIL